MGPGRGQFVVYLGVVRDVVIVVVAAGGNVPSLPVRCLSRPAPWYRPPVLRSARAGRAGRRATRAPTRAGSGGRPSHRRLVPPPPPRPGEGAGRGGDGGGVTGAGGGKAPGARRGCGPVKPGVPSSSLWW